MIEETDGKYSWKGSLTELKTHVLGISGLWTSVQYGQQFRTKDRATLTYYPQRGAIVFGGPQSARTDLIARLMKVVHQ